MDSPLETVEELFGALADRPPAEALITFVDWLDRRDHVSEEIATDQLAAGLEAVADELRSEALENLSPETRGLVLAAAVLLDTAFGVRAGDGLPAGEASAADD